MAHYLESRGWQSAKTNIQQLLAEAGLPSMPLVDGSLAIGNNYYCTSIKR